MNPQKNDTTMITEYSPTDEIQRMTNEINRLLNSETSDKENIESLIIKLRSIKICGNKRGAKMTETLTQNNMRIVVIPPKSKEEIKQSKHLRVAAYCRVSTDEEEQINSYKAQIEYYTEKINKNPEWQMAGIFAYEGISGTQAKKRPGFLNNQTMPSGKIDFYVKLELNHKNVKTVKLSKRVLTVAWQYIII